MISKGNSNKISTKYINIIAVIAHNKIHMYYLKDAIITKGFLRSMIRFGNVKCISE